MIFKVFLFTLGLTILVFLLRGFRVLGFMPGGLILLLIAVSIAFGLISRWIR